MDEPRKCINPDCFESARVRDKFCKNHGAGFRKCKEPECEKYGLHGGFCKLHGGIDWKKKCTRQGCDKYRWKGLECSRHYRENHVENKTAIKKKITRPCDFLQTKCERLGRVHGYCLRHANQLDLVCCHKTTEKRKCRRQILIGEKRCSICIKL